MTQRDDMGREVGGGSGLGTHVHPWQIHVNVWQNHYHTVISLQLKEINFFKKRRLSQRLVQHCGVVMLVN